MAQTRKKYQSRTKKPFLFEIDGMDFETVRRVPGPLFVDFVRGMGAMGEGERDVGVVADLMQSVREMFQMVMEPEEFSRFWKWGKTADGPDFELLVEVLSDMVADDTDRPTARPSRSARGPQRTGPTSTED